MNKIITLDIIVTNKDADFGMHPVILEDDKELILIDCCLVGNWELIKNSMKEKNINPEKLTKVIITHQDLDHIGSLVEIKKEIPNVKIYAHKLEIPYIDGAKKPLRLEQAEKIYDTLSENEKIGAKIFEERIKAVPKVDIDVSLSGNEEFPWCGGTKIINTPGHTPGHICIYVESKKTLISGDAVIANNGKLEIANPNFTLDMKKAMKSIKNLLNYEIEEVICFHGGIVRGDIKAQIRAMGN